MGTVHGVYLKYVGLSALSYVGYRCIAYDRNDSSSTTGEATTIPISMIEMSTRLLHAISSSSNSTTSTITSYRDHSTSTTTSSTLFFQTIPAVILAYSTILNGIIALLFKSEVGMKMIGKNSTTGQIPTWSYILFFPFHIPTRLYTYIHSLQDKKKNIPVASEVQPGWYVGGCYGHLLEKNWDAVIDLTVEFPESTIQHTKSYLSIPTWDGIPASPAQLEQGATFAANVYNNNSNSNTEKKDVNILIHCAHGRGRSTTMMCAALVKAGLYKNWQDAFELGIKPGRSVCKLNTRMKQNLTEWQRLYVDNKKGQ